MDRKEHKILNDAYLRGDLILGVKYRHNSHVKVTGENSDTISGWIVGVELQEPEPIYTIETEDGDPCFEASESKITLIHDPHI